MGLKLNTQDTWLVFQCSFHLNTCSTLVSFLFQFESCLSRLAHQKGLQFLLQAFNIELIFLNTLKTLFINSLSLLCL